MIGTSVMKELVSEQLLLYETTPVTASEHKPYF